MGLTIARLISVGSNDETRALVTRENKVHLLTDKFHSALFFKRIWSLPIRIRIRLENL